ncbi:MAG TPA: UbiA family prenyltransferase [Candidatus Dormibacteraeota bacterium]|nr:UbiA family prenyltransferase [Candidatus Dormibacteraeota bacterium]
MSKRKRTPKPGGDEPTDDASVKEDMVHVTPDLLAGTPDVFAEKKPEETAPEPEASAEPAEPAEPAAEETPDVEPTAAEPTEATALTEPEPIAEPAPAPAPSSTPPLVSAVPYPAKTRGEGSSAALGIVLVVVGVFALLIVLSGADLTQNGWPLFILIPGLTLLVVGFISFGSVATIPGGIVTMLGVVLAYANSTGDWPVWAYAWSLVIPFGIGLGMYLQALRDHDQNALRSGRTLLFVGLMIFIIGFVLFESILGISGRDYFGPVGKAALPGLLIIVGVILLVRSIQRSRQA